MAHLTPQQLADYLKRNPKQRGAVAAQLGFDFGAAEPKGADDAWEAGTSEAILVRLQATDDLLERAEARSFMRKVRLWEKVHPELQLLHHIPNGGKRDIATAQQLWREGVRPGIPDYFLPVPRQGFNGLYIELKRVRGGEVSPEQKALIPRLRAQGYRVEVCRGWKAAWAVLEDYLGVKMPLTLIPQ